jgi:hypothetical protein
MSLEPPTKQTTNKYTVIKVMWHAEEESNNSVPQTNRQQKKTNVSFVS